MSIGINKQIGEIYKSYFVELKTNYSELLDNVICVFNCDKVFPKEFRDLVIFDEKWIDDIDTILGLYISGEYFAGEKLDDKNRKDMVEIASRYLKEISPIVLGDGKRLYYKYTPDDVFVSWDIELTDKDNKSLDYYAERENNHAIKLIEFIVCNNVVAKWGNLFCKSINFPLFICDAFDNISKSNVKEIIELTKHVDRQVFICLSKTNQKVEALCNKVIDLKK
ncbi:MAG: hypothetical protein IKB98_02605 [Clostridia bacterium]|nr:hypothetical protein [Clostridia bacterium]